MNGFARIAAHQRRERAQHPAPEISFERGLSVARAVSGKRRGGKHAACRNVSVSSAVNLRAPIPAKRRRVCHSGRVHLAGREAAEPAMAGGKGASNRANSAGAKPR